MSIEHQRESLFIQANGKQNEPKPLILQRADPFVLKKDGNYYFTASVPEYDRIELRSASSIDGLKTAKPHTVWTRHKSGIMSEHIWAPEIHFFDGAWYIYFAASEVERKWELRPYVLKCEGDPMHDAWIELGQIQAAENDQEAFTDFSLDATVFELGGKRYLVWAEKVGSQFGVSNLYIAQMETPSQLKTARVLISTPEFDWERIDFCVNEGAAPLLRNGKVFLTYSASATGHMYCMGLLTCDQNADPLDPNSWKKSRSPVFKTDESKKIFGPGHNCFTIDERGNDICVFHARPYKDIVGDPLYDPNRHTYLMKVQFDEEGCPIFDIC